MKKNHAIALDGEARTVAEHFSNPDRAYNTTNETFVVRDIKPLSGTTALVTFKKNTGKIAIAFFYIVKDSWRYFFPTESHILGMQKLAEQLYQVERHNYELNFDDSPIVARA